MCGRYGLYSSQERLIEHFGLAAAPPLKARYNIAPSDAVGIIRIPSGYDQRVWDQVTWGLIPHWAKDRTIGYKLINARAESVAEKPSFRDAFKYQRCLVPADIFYEWAAAGGKKVPYAVRLQNQQPFAFAGLWDRWKDGEEVIESCTIITTGANDLLRPIHERMPVILPETDYERWLDRTTQNPAALQALLKPYPSNAMTTYPVSTRVNRPENDDRECIAPLPQHPSNPGSAARACPDGIRAARPLLRPRRPRDLPCVTPRAA
ncbi:MAG: SOS response-associated peptidase [Nitrospiraceae bacterium]